MNHPLPAANSRDDPPAARPPPPTVATGRQPPAASRQPSLERTLAELAQRLLGCRVPAGHWEGELSSSALATATSAAALGLMGVGEAGRGGVEATGGARARLAGGGLRWLARHQNPDGGWGDTVLSPSNISTTALCWVAFSLAAGPA